jgi:catecholate siderophore receptor
MTKRQHYLTLLAAAGSIGHSLMAQTPTADTKTPPAGDVVQLEKLEVSDVPIEKNIIPSTRPFNSVFGTDQNITEIPRNVTIISREQLTTIGIKDVRDFSKLTSSSYTKTNFGAPANPDIRGSSADVFQNGVRERTTSNGNGLPIDFNSVESINIVKGPATAVQGSSQYVGGFVDMQTKRPTFDKQKTDTSLTIGSDEVRRWTVDHNSPVNDKLAVRLSYTGEDSEGYFESEYRKTQSLYTAATWKPTDTYELFLNASASYMEYTENWGINRPTQNLIDDFRYRTGVNNNGGSTPTALDPQNATNVLAPFPGNSVAWGPEVKLSRRVRTLKPGDNSVGRNFKLQAIQTVDLNPDTKLVNNNLFTFTRRETLSSYYYSEIIDPSYTFQSRWEYQKKFDQSSFNTGLDARYLSVKAYSDYGFEPAGVWDLSRSREGIDIYRSTSFQSTLNSPSGFGRSSVPGYANRYYGQNTFGSDSNESTGLFLAPFIQGDYKLTDRLTALGGGRLDFTHVDASEPYSGRDDQVFVTNPNLNGSLVYKVTEKVSTYATYNYSRNTAGAEGNGGGFLLTRTIGPFALDIDEESYKTPAELFEVGFKSTLVENKLFLGGALFDQSFTRRTQGGGENKFEFQGAEIELNYQPNKNFFATFGYSYIKGDVTNPNGFFESVSTNISSVDASVRRLAPGTTNIEVQGLPNHLFNSVVSYTFDNGFGVSLNGTLHSEINSNFSGSLVIPWQFEINSSVFYTYKNWNARLSIFNITDELNFAPNNGIYGNESIFVQPGVRGEFTLGYKF